MRILVKTKKLKHNARGTFTHDFYMELRRQADVSFSYENPGGEYDVCIGGKGKVSVKIQTDIHKSKRHATPQELAKSLMDFDIVLMRYVYITYPGIPVTFYKDKLGDKAIFFPWSMCHNRWQYSERKDNDVCMLGTSNEMYPIRAAAKSLLPDTGYSYIMGNLPMTVKQDNTAIKKKLKNVFMGDSYIKALQRSKVMITDASRYGCPVKKYIEAMAAGCLLVADRPHHADELGLVDGENYVEISKDNWREKLDYYLNNDTERLRITRNARELFERKHTNKVRVKELLSIL